MPAYYGHFRPRPGCPWIIMAGGASWHEVWRKLARLDLRLTGRESFCVLPRGVPPYGPTKKRRQA